MPDPLDRTFAALSDPTRRAILAELSLGARTVTDLVAAHALSQPAISKHLKVLEGAGLIRRGRAAQTRPCILNPEGLQAVDGWLERYRGHWTGAFDRMEALIRRLGQGNGGKA